MVRLAVVENKSSDDRGSLVHLVASLHVSESDPITPLTNNPDSASFDKYYKSHCAGQVRQQSIK